MILRGGTVIDPSQNIHHPLDVAVDGATIQSLGSGLADAPETQVIDVRGKYVCPGLIDLHGHWYRGSMFGVDPDLCLAHGVTTVVDAGTAGFANFAEFRRSQIDQARVEIAAFINIAAYGIPTILAGELEDLRMARPKETAEVILQNPDTAVGVKIRVGAPCGPNSDSALDLAVEAAAASALPLMMHVGTGAATSAMLQRLRPGDILTHCFQRRGPSILESDALTLAAQQARERGVLFDVGHGCGSFSWNIARRAFEHHFLPDTISTDLHRYSIDRWAIDMPTTLSKFLHIGMTLDEVILKSTWKPAQIIRREQQIGTLKAGTVADILVFDLAPGEFYFEDAHLSIEKADRLITPTLIVKSGRLIYPNEIVRDLRPLNELDREFLRSVEETAS